MDATRHAAAALVGPVGCSCMKLRRLMRVVARHYDAYLARCGLKTTQYSLLTAVQAHGPLSPGALARTQDLDASTVTRNLRPLLEAGWLVMQPGPDARSRLIALTPAGLQKRREARALWQQAQRAFNQRVGEPTVTALHDLIETCHGRLAGPDERGDDA